MKAMTRNFISFFLTHRLKHSPSSRTHLEGILPIAFTIKT